MKKIVTLLLALALVVSTLCVSMATAFAEENNTLTIYLEGTCQEEKTITAKVGDTVVYTCYLNVHDVTAGNTCGGVNTQGYLNCGDSRITYQNEYLSLPDMTDDEKDACFPNVSPNLTYNFYKTGIYFNWLTLKKNVKFDDDSTVYCSIPFKVEKAGYTTIKNQFETLAAYTDNMDKIVFKGSVVPGKEFKFNADAVVYDSIKADVDENENLKLSWNAVAYSNKYNLFKREAGSNSRWEQIATNLTEQTYTDSDVYLGTPYEYTIEALSPVGVVVRGKDPYPGEVILDSISLVKKGNSLVASWKPMKNTNEYTIYYRVNGGNWIKWKNVTSTSVTDTSIQSNTTYAYAVKDASGKNPDLYKSYDVKYIASGWNYINGKYYYYDDNGNIMTGLIKDGNYYYYFDTKTGVMQEGWVKMEDGNYRYFRGNGSGRMLTGWQNIGGSYFYLEPSETNPNYEIGEMYEGCQWVAESKGYFCFKENGSGKMYEGWALLNDGHYRYCKGGGSGRMLTGWQNIGGSYYYLEPSETSEDHVIGEMYEGCQWVAESKGYFCFRENGSGRMYEGWAKLNDGHYRYCKGNGSGRMLTGWQYISGSYYYLEPTTENDVYSIGAMYEGYNYVAESDGYWFFKEGGSGRMLTGWVQMPYGTYKYFTPGSSGRMKTGWQKIDGAWYFLEDKDEMTIGEMYEDRKYVDSSYDGKATVGYWYFKPNGSGRVLTGNIDGNYYDPSSTPIPGKEIPIV